MSAHRVHGFERFNLQNISGQSILEASGQSSNISNNVAKLPVEYSISIPRGQLRPGYGDGFAGAPVNLQVVPCGARERDRGEGGEQASREAVQRVGGAGHV
jgi:hypothetical protein